MGNLLIEQRLHEELTKADIRQEVKSALSSSEMKEIIAKLVKQQIKSDKDVEDKIVDVAGNVLTQLYKTLWTKRNFWKSSLSNKTA